MDKQMTISAFSDELAQVRTKKKLHLNIDYLYCFKTYDGNQAIFGILGGTHQYHIEKNAWELCGKQ